MTNLPISISDNMPTDNNTPLPLLVAKRWNFPLAHVETDEGIVYAVQDWIRGLLAASDVRKVWTKFQKTDTWKQMSSSRRRLPYKATDGKTYQRDYVNDKGLYLVAQYLRAMDDRPILDEIKKFLAAAGALVDEIRIDPEKVLDAAIEAYRAQGKSDEWIQNRMQGKISRHKFTTALTNAVFEVLSPHHYAVATDDVYRGLWERTAAHLRHDLELTKKESLRDNQPVMALYFQGITEESIAKRLGKLQEITWAEAREIVRTIARLVGEHARALAEFLGIDIATDKPLLK